MTDMTYVLQARDNPETAWDERGDIIDAYETGSQGDVTTFAQDPAHGQLIVRVRNCPDMTPLEIIEHIQRMRGRDKVDTAEFDELKQPVRQRRNGRAWSMAQPHWPPGRWNDLIQNGVVQITYAQARNIMLRKTARVTDAGAEHRGRGRPVDDGDYVPPGARVRARTRLDTSRPVRGVILRG